MAYPTLPVNDPGDAQFDRVIYADGEHFPTLDPAIVFQGDYERAGPDLVIRHDGESTLVVDYFSVDTPPALSAPNGGFLAAETVLQLAGATGSDLYAQTGGGGAATEIGKVIKLEGSATATSGSNGAKPLAIGDPVFQGDVIQTGASSKLGISFIDETVFSMSADARMVLDELVFDPANAAGSSMSFNLVQGAFVFVAGQIAPNGDMKIETPVATMGIRGTTPKVVINTELGVSEFTVLPDPDTGKVGDYVLIDKVTGNIIGNVASSADKWVVSTLSGEAVQISKTGLDLLEDQVALDEIRNLFSLAQNDRAQLDGSNSFTQFAFNAANPTQQVAVGEGTGDQVSGDGTVVAEAVPQDDPPVAADDFFQTDDRSITIAGSNVIDDNGLGIDIDPEGFPLSVIAVNDDPLVFVGGNASVLLPSGALLVINSPGDIVYSPNGAYNFLGLGDQDVDTFTYTIQDAGGQTDVGTIEITLTGRNDQPELTDVASTVLTGGFTEAGDTDSPTVRTVLGNVTFFDTDASDTHTAAASAPVVTWSRASGDVALPAVGTIVLNLTETAADPTPTLEFAADGSLISRPPPVEGDVAFTYSVPESDVDFLAVGETLTLVYTITVTDDSGVGAGGAGDSPAFISRDVTVTITGTNDVPTISAATDVAETLPESELAFTTSGEFEVRDVDITDVVSITGVTVATAGNDSDVAALNDATLLGFFSPQAGGVIDGTGILGTVSWDFTTPVDQFDYLAVGESLVLTYTVTVADDNGADVTQDVTITITGTNDTPFISAATDVAETLAEAETALNTTGSFEVTDVDTTDVVSITGVTVATSGDDGDAALPANPTLLGFFTPQSGVEIDGTANVGTVSWDFTTPVDQFDYLAVGESLVLTYTVTVADDNGADVTQDVTITITGTNDTPDIFAGTGDKASSSLTEANGALTDSGTLSVTDVDTTDVVNASIGTPTIGGTGPAASAPNATTAATYFTISANPAVDGTANSGGIAWDFDSIADTFDYLADGETLILTYPITVNDGNSATDTQDVVVTITGTNDAPNIAVASTTDSATSNLTEGNGGLTDSGTLTVSDADVTNVVNASVTLVSVGGTGPAGSAPTSTIAGQYFTLDANPILDNATSSASLTWNFNSGTEAFDYLAAGDTLVLSYTVTVDDGGGTTDDQVVTVTITGTNDAPVVSAASDPAAVNEGTPPVPALESFNLLSTVTATDADHNETPTVDETSVVISANANSDTADFSSLVINGSGDTTRIDVDTANFDFLAQGEAAIFDVAFNVVSGVDTVARQITITINGVNDAPVATSGTPTQNYLTGDGAVVVDSQLTLVDPDTPNLVGAEVAITANFTLGEDTLGFVDQLGISGMYDATTGVLTLSGPASVADYQTALRSVTFENTATPPSESVRTISFTADDGIAVGPAATTDITVVDPIIGTPLPDVLTGDGNVDFIFGLDGVDTLSGLGGDDFLEGGGGDDNLSGGTGSDVFSLLDDLSTDTVTDFDFGDINAPSGDVDVLNIEDFNLTAGDIANITAETNGVETIVEFGPVTLAHLPNTSVGSEVSIVYDASLAAAVVPVTMA